MVFVLGSGMFAARNKRMSVGDGDELFCSEITEMEVTLEAEALSIDTGITFFCTQKQ